tara:strand:- start:3243 stop:3479 length:237 start_codon:yes stop_codon:yes gene_type:complete
MFFGSKTKKCKYCREKISKKALKCLHCGEYLIDKLRAEKNKSWEDGLLRLIKKIFKWAMFLLLLWGIFALFEFYALLS